MVAYIPGENEASDPKKLRRAILGLSQGRSNGVGTVTLTASATSTTVTDQNCAAGSQIILTPQTSDAAGALGTTYVPPATVLNGSFVIQHASASSVDRTFFYAIAG